MKRIFNSSEDYTEKNKSIKAWYRLLTKANEHYIQVKNDLKRNNRKKKDEEAPSQAEGLIEKKYKKDKTQIKISKNQSF